jgi:hypothetical protein
LILFSVVRRRPLKLEWTGESPSGTAVNRRERDHDSLEVGWLDVVSA